MPRGGAAATSAPVALELGLARSAPVTVSSTQQRLEGGLAVTAGATLGESAQLDAYLLRAGGGVAPAGALVHVARLVRARGAIRVVFRGSIPAGRYVVRVDAAGRVEAGATGTKTLVTRPFQLR